MSARIVYLDCWKNADGKFYWREMAWEEYATCGPMHREVVKGKTLTVICVTFLGSVQMTRGEYVACASSKVLGYGIPFHLDLSICD